MTEWTTDFPAEPGFYIWANPKSGEMGFRTYGPLTERPTDPDIPIETHKDFVFGPIPDPPVLIKT